MKINEIKQEMLDYRDLYGNDIYMTDEINNAKTKQELANILDKYESHLEDMLSDAQSHLQNFRKRVGLNNY